MAATEPAGVGATMARRCAQCGNELFIGETACPACRAVVPNAVEDAAAQGVRLDDSGTGPPPPEGLGLIIGKTRADQDIINQGRAREDASSQWYQSAAGYDTGPGFDDVARLVKPERDAQGNVKWDLKYALVGALVVAVLCGLAFFVLSARFSRISNTVSRVKHPTVTVVAPEPGPVAQPDTNR